MKVKELIEELKKIDQELEIRYESEGLFCEINHIEYFSGKYSDRDVDSFYYIW